MDKRPGWQTALLWLIPVGFLVFFFYQPLIAIFNLVFSPRFSAGWQNFSINQVLGPLGFTLWQAALSTLLTLVLGLPAAWLFARFDFPCRKLLRALTLIPFILPTVVVAAAFNTLIGPRGWLNLGLMGLFGLSSPPIQMLNSLPAIVLAHVFYNTSIIVRVVGTALTRLNPRIHQAAQVLGASPYQALREVTLPLLSPSIIGAALLVFLFDFTSFGVILMLGGPRFATLEVEIYIQAMHMLNLPVAGLLSLVQLGFTLLITFIQNRIATPRFGKAAVSSEHTTLRKPRKGWERAWVWLMAVLLVAIMAFPLISLVSRSVITLDAARGERGVVEAGFTLRYYTELFQNRTGSLFYVPPIAALKNSLLISAATVLIATVLGLLSAYGMVKPGKLTAVLEPFIMLPLGASAVTLGLGFLVVFFRPPWTNHDLSWLLPVAHSLVALPLVVRTLLPSLRGIPHSLRRAATSMGASPLRVFTEVDLPILLRPILVSMVFAFTISLGEFGAASFLATPGNPTIPVAIFRYISQPGALNYGQALAMSTLLMLVCVAGSLLIENFRLPGEELF